MKILIIGSPESIYIKYYIKNVLVPLNLNILLSCSKELRYEDKMFYDEYNVRLVNLYEKRGILGKLPKISTLISYIKNLKKYTSNGNIEFIQLHYVGNPQLMKFSYKFLKKYTKRLISTFWGSDILDIDDKRARQIEGLMTVSDKIVLSTAAMKEKFQEYYGNKYDHKIVSYLFGNQIIERSLEVGNKERKKKNPDKYNVAIGYNGSKRQQHLKVIEELSMLPKDVKRKLNIIVQMSYSMPNTEYKDSIKYSIYKADLCGYIIEKYLNIDETIQLRKNIDIFINSQTTDALSSSVLEYIYFGAEVLNPKWINYKEWESMGISYNKYESFSELNNLIIKIIQGGIHTDHVKNASIIEKNFTWKNNAPKWQNLYK